MYYIDLSDPNRKFYQNSYKDEGFLREGFVEEKKDHLVRWSEVLKSKELGGLGIGIALGELGAFAFNNKLISSKYGNNDRWDSEVVVIYSLQCPMESHFTWICCFLSNTNSKSIGASKSCFGMILLGWGTFLL